MSQLTTFGMKYDSLPSVLDTLDATIEDLKEDLAGTVHNPQVIMKHEKVTSCAIYLVELYFWRRCLVHQTFVCVYTNDFQTDLVCWLFAEVVSVVEDAYHHPPSPSMYSRVKMLGGGLSSW